VPPAPTAGAALRAALSGFYYNSLKLIPANIVWGTLFLVTLGALLLLPVVGLILLLVALPFPTAGIFRLAALIARGEPSHLSDAFGWREFGRRALGTGLVVGAVSVVLLFNIVVGIGSFEIVGWGFATAAFWGLIVVWLVASALWPLLLDPLRAQTPVADLVRLSIVVALVKPARYLGLMLALTIVLVVSTVMFVALLTVSVAFFALATAAYAIPMADRIEQRETFVTTA
jgi:hypothetical protein